MPAKKTLQDFAADIPWNKLSEVIGPHFIQANICRLQVSCDTMLRVYFLQKRYSISSASAEKALFEIKALRDFSLINQEEDIIPNDLCIQSFNQLVTDKELELVLLGAFDLPT